MVGGVINASMDVTGPWSAGVINGSIDVVECMLEHGGAVKLPIFKWLIITNWGHCFI